MILTTHAFVGAAVGATTANPVLGLGAGMVSHWISDVVPHWQYRLRSENPGNPMQKLIIGRHSVVDIAKVLADTAVGLGGIVIVLYASGVGLSGLVWSPVLWGAIGGMVPDGAQFLYYGARWRWLAPLQRIHDFFHAPRFIADPVRGLAIQGVLIIAAAMILRVLV
jgi:hypothetical protein